MTQEHPFARYVAALGRGPGKSRDLTGDEAYEAMAMILEGALEPMQLGAFLMLMRYKKETPEELAGFVRAVRDHLGQPPAAPRVDLDWPSYADKHKQLPWFVLSALLLAENGVKVLMHGITGFADGFAPTGAALAALGIVPCKSLDAAAQALARGNFAYASLEDFCPALGRLFDLRPVLGLRSPVNTLTRDLNPLGAPWQINGVFHPPYRPLHQQAAALLGQPHAAIFKGGGGEAQRTPDKPVVVATLDDGAAGEEEWPALTPGSRYPWRGEELDAGRVAALWTGALEEEAPVAAVTGTAAIALKLLGRAADMGEAQRMAEEMWRDRPRQRYGGTVRRSA